MNVSDVIHGRVATIDLAFADGGTFPDGLVPKSEVFLHGDEGDGWRLDIGGDVRVIEGAAPPDLDTLRQVGNSGLPRLVWLAQATPPAGGSSGRHRPGCILVQVHEFPAALAWDEAVEIGVESQLVDDLRKLLQRSISVESAVHWLAERMLLQPRRSGGPQRALLSGSPTPDARVLVRRAATRTETGSGEGNAVRPLYLREAGARPRTRPAAGGPPQA